MTVTTIPATFDGLIALLPPDLRAMADPLLAMLPPATRDALAAAVPALMAAVTGGDRQTFEAALEPLGLDIFAPLIWEQARAQLAPARP